MDEGAGIVVKGRFEAHGATSLGSIKLRRVSNSLGLARILAPNSPTQP
ncbi:hypothetical protein ABI_34510 [Asticcacaulis biprosthecium C19]|uniref:Uncharacterized protein n=1 Tax=Asticcacaulis biprosthecium C19 TaxID=715226 RepID=F4QQE3_9CAUL|nr:hypothetical protein ABI_34510 [Asticcacaulis biprosthecium C19]